MAVPYEQTWASESNNCDMVLKVSLEVIESKNIIIVK